MINITIYTMPKCEACERTKMWLDEHDLGFNEVDITEDDEDLKALRKLMNITIKEKMK